MGAKGNWRAQYAKKLTDAAAAVRAVRRGQRVFIGSGAAEPQALVGALAERAEQLTDTEIYHIMTLGVAPYAEARFTRNFRHNAFFIGSNVRDAIHEGRADYTPVFLSEIPRLFRTRRVPLDVALIQVSPPDSIGSRFYSGIGGQLDFIRGAARSEGGKPVIALRSTAKGDAVSRIVPRLHAAGVVTTRGDVHYVVTEYGVADLWGKSVRERAMALINIAHPRFREELLAEAKRQHLVYEDQILMPAARYPWQWETTETLKDGRPVLFRAVRPTDEPLMKDLFYSCSDQTIYDRYFGYVKAMPHEKLQRVVNVDYVNEMTVVAIAEAEEGVERMAAAGSYLLDRATNMADVSFLVQDSYHGLGIGTVLLRQLMKVARSNGVRGFTADVFSHNRPMLQVFHKSGRELKSTLSGGVYHLEFLL